MPKKQSSGTLLYRQSEAGLEVLLVHASGNYNRHKPWSIPKGEPDRGEQLEAAARRETWEETGVRVAGELHPLGDIVYKKSGKRIYCFAAPAPSDCQPSCDCWEIDCAEFLALPEARQRIHPDQAPFLDRLEVFLGSTMA